MATRQNLDRDEEQRIQEHEAVKDDVRRQVHSEIAGRVTTTDADRSREAAAADALKRQAVDDVTDTERELGRSRTAARGSQFIDYAFFLVYAIIALATALAAIGARESAGFTRLIYAMAYPFVAPFRGIMHDPSAGSSRLMLSYFVALAAYLLLHVAINGALRLFAERKTAV